MNSDFRLSVDYLDHPKIIKARRRFGDAFVIAHIKLIGFTAKWKPDGNLTGMDDEEIAIAAGWVGDAQEFVAALVELRLLDEVDGSRQMHDWDDHNPFAATHAKRSEAAKANAKKRWNKKAGISDSDRQSNADGNADGIPDGNPLTVSSRNDPDPSVSDRTTPQLGAPHPDTDRLCKILGELTGTEKPPSIEWIDDMERILIRDKRDPTIVEAAIRFAAGDKFWRDVIVEPKRILKNWDELVKQMSRNKTRDAPGVSDDAIANFLARHEGRTA